MGGINHPKMVAQRFKPGQSGNPAGTQKRPTMETLVAKVLDERIPGSDKTKREALARVFVDEMLKRKGYAIKEYLEREWPKVQKHEVSGPDGDPLEISGESAWDRLSSSMDRVEARSGDADGDREPVSDPEGGRLQ